MVYIISNVPELAAQLARLGCDLHSIPTCGMNKAVPDMHALGHGLQSVLG